jgi:hypothetical protein
MKTLSLAISSLLLSLSSLIVACGGAGESGSSSQEVATFGKGSECGALEMGIDQSVTYGIYNDLETKCLALGGQCVPLAGSGTSANTDKVFCVVPAP